MSQPGGEFQVDAAALVTHAREVDGIGDGLATAAEAAETVRTDTGAYGQVCQLVPVMLNGLQQFMVDGILTAAASAHDTADALRSVAADYDEADRSAAERLKNSVRDR
ncbi:type VII secretion target [Actinoplanes sp. NPDC049548]|uniref:type VII secretion target n=1 Tax=Actinoplanes sp. NPDC049548 TaxID=3155152 RepID=UPI00343B70FB